MKQAVEGTRDIKTDKVEYEPALHIYAIASEKAREIELIRLERDGVTIDLRDIYARASEEAKGLKLVRLERDGVTIDVQDMFYLPFGPETIITSSTRPVIR